MEVCYKALQAIIILGFSFTSWISLKKLWHNDVATAIGTILLVNSHYFCLNVYARGAVGESIAMCFMPLFFYGLYNLVSENYSHPIFLIIGILGSGLSHTITTAFCLLAGIIVCLFNLKKILTKDITRKLVLSILIVLSLSAFFWMPFLEQLEIQHYKFELPWVHPYQECTSLFGSLSNPRYSIGFLLSLCVGVVIILSPTHVRNKILLWVAPAYFLLFLLSVKEFWSILDPIVVSIQFPWRLLSIITILLVMSVAYGSSFLVKEMGTRQIFALMFVLMFLDFEMNRDYYKIRIDDKLSINEEYMSANAYNTGGGNEWMPLDFDYSDDISKNYHSSEALTESGIYIRGAKSNLTFTVKLVDNSNYIDVPFLYYKGYTAYYNDNSKERLSIAKSDHGTVRVYLSGNAANQTITVTYRETFLSKLGRLISILIFIFLLFVACHKRQYRFIKS